MKEAFEISTKRFAARSMMTFLKLREMVAKLWRKYQIRQVDERKFRKMMAAVLKI